MNNFTLLDLKDEGRRLGKRILLLTPTLAGGEAQRFFCVLLQNLERNRFEPHLALMQKRGELAAASMTFGFQVAVASFFLSLL